MSASARDPLWGPARRSIVVYATGPSRSCARRRAHDQKTLDGLDAAVLRLALLGAVGRPPGCRARRRALSRPASMPRLTSAATTAAARSAESFRFTSSVPVPSVWPTTKTFSVSVLLQQLDHLHQRRLGLGLDDGLAGVEVQPVERHLSFGRQPLLERRGVGDHFLLEALRLDDEQLVDAAFVEGAGLQIGLHAGLLDLRAGDVPLGVEYLPAVFFAAAS